MCTVERINRNSWSVQQLLRKKKKRKKKKNNSNSRGLTVMNFARIPRKIFFEDFFNPVLHRKQHSKVPITATRDLAAVL